MKILSKQGARLCQYLVIGGGGISAGLSGVSVGVGLVRPTDRPISPCDERSNKDM